MQRRGVAGGRRRTASWHARLPGADVQARPERPRPASGGRAVIHSGAALARGRAGRIASLLVELISSRAVSAQLVLRARRPFGPATRTSPAAALRRVDERRRNGNEQRERDSAASAITTVAPPARRARRAPGRLVEVHDLDDAQVVVGADDARQHADDGERHRAPPRSPAGTRRTWRRSRRAAECRPARTSASPATNAIIGLVRDRPARSAMLLDRAARRGASHRMQAKVPSVMTT